MFLEQCTPKENPIFSNAFIVVKNKDDDNNTKIVTVLAHFGVRQMNKIYSVATMLPGNARSFDVHWVPSEQANRCKEN